MSYNLGNGSISADQREVIDAGFLELTRLGILPPNDPDVVASLDVVDQVIRVETRSGSGFYRYGTQGDGTEDGYGDCWVGDPAKTVLRTGGHGRRATAAAAITGPCCRASERSTRSRPATGRAR